MEWKKFSEFFHPSYENKIRPWIESKDCDELYSKLKEMSRRGVKIAPDSSNTWRCFKETPLNEIKVIICGFCPYHSFTKEMIPIADGLCMSCETTGKLQPSLSAWYLGMEEELYNGLNLDYYKEPSLQYLAKQGVLLFNSSLTVSKDKPGSHGQIWHNFTKYFFEEVVGYTGIPVLFLGNEARQFQKYVTPFTHSYSVKHPAYYARLDQSADLEGAIKKINQIIWENNRFKISWLCSQEEIEDIINGYEHKTNTLDSAPF